MTELTTANIGSYPRIGDEKDQQRYRRGRAHFENKEISAHAFNDVEQSVIQEVLHEQANCGADQVTDGLVTWQDPISHFCHHLTHVESGGLRRYFDNNFYFHTPWISPKSKPKGTALLKEWLYAKQISPAPVRTIITGPVTLALFTQSRWKSLETLARRRDFFTHVIEREIRTLVQNGASHIQIDEPALAWFPTEIKAASKSLSQLALACKPALSDLSLSFRPLADIIPLIAHWPFDALTLDFTQDGETLLKTLLQSKLTKTISFGVVDARNTKAENVDEAARIVRTWCHTMQPQKCFITPSAGLEFLPRSHAASKLRTLSRIRECVRA